MYLRNSPQAPEVHLPFSTYQPLLIRQTPASAASLAGYAFQSNPTMHLTGIE
jgi:hypothetical protein